MGETLQLACTDVLFVAKIAMDTNQHHHGYSPSRPSRSMSHCALLQLSGVGLRASNYAICDAHVAFRRKIELASSALKHDTVVAGT